MNIRNIINFDYLLFLSVIALSVIGILFIYSSGVNADGISISNEYIKQTVWLLSGVILLFAVSLYDYNKIGDRMILLFIFAMLLLLYTRFFGRTVKGARSWIGIGDFGIQVSEFTKIIYIVFLAWYLTKSQNEAELRRFIKAALIMFVPMGLILLQPDLGTASVYLPIFLVMCFIAGLPLRYVFGLLGVAACTIIFTLLPLWETTILRRPSIAVKILGNKNIALLIILSLTGAAVIAAIGFLLLKKRYYYWIGYVLGIVTVSITGALVGSRVLKEYQMKRLIIFLAPNSDPLGAGWNIIQSMTAIGSGGKTGLGFLKGTQSHYRFLPEQSTDFIFSILSEEWGFTGGLLVFGLYAVIFLRISLIIKKTNDLFGKLIASGIIGMLFFHFVVNIGMVMGFMPITGIPLLFLSYGGSSLWTAMIAVGIVIGINLRQL
ncbi:MAG: rod shape-determining protein RodA [Treponema sp.]